MVYFGSYAKPCGLSSRLRGRSLRWLARSATAKERKRVCISGSAAWLHRPRRESRGGKGWSLGGSGVSSRGRKTRRPPACGGERFSILPRRPAGSRDAPRKFEGRPPGPARPAPRASAARPIPGYSGAPPAAGPGGWNAPDVGETTSQPPTPRMRCRGRSILLP